MSLPHMILWAVVLAVAAPASFRNPTAGALALCYMISECIYLLTGKGLAVDYYIFPDTFVLAVIFAKPAACSFQPYRSTFHQFKCIVLERSTQDRIVMLAFPAMWAIYISDLHPFYQWWGLWALSIVQFLAAGWEGFSKIYRSRAVSETLDPSSGDVFRRLAWSRGYG